MSARNDDWQHIAALCTALAADDPGPGQGVLVEQLLDRVTRARPEVAAVIGSILAGQNPSPAKEWGRSLLESSRVSPQDIAKFFRDPPEVDVLLLTVKEVEWTATLRAFGVAAGESPIKVGRADEVYVVERNGLVFGIAFIGFAGNVESAMRVAELVTNVRFKAAILIGMAAGPRGEVHLGDVVISESVIAYEYVTLTAAGPILSPVVHTVPMRRVRLARTISQIDPAWKHRLRMEIRGCDDFVEIPDDEVEKLDETWACSVKTGAILAGAKLIEDGSLQQMTQDFGDRIKAAEMEGAGFAAMCSEAGIEWLVVRGICDYGEPDRRKGWQFAASFAAAAFVRDGLASGRISVS